MAIIQLNQEIAVPIRCQIMIQVDDRGKIEMQSWDPSIPGVGPAPVDPSYLSLIFSQLTTASIKLSKEKKTNAAKTDTSSNDGDGNHRAG